LLDHDRLVRQVRHNHLDNKECGEAKDRKPPGMGYHNVIPVWQSFIPGNIEKELHETSEQRRANVEYRLITGGVGHNLPQEAPQAFAKGVIDVDAF
jgi:hypothetical protein